MKIRAALSALFGRKSKIQDNDRLQALMDFSLAAPCALDPEKLSGAIRLLDQFGWNVSKAARHINNRTLRDFDDAMKAKGDDPFGMAGGNFPPGPAA